MSNLIRSHKAVTTAQSLPPPAQSSAATAPAQMDHLPIGPGVSHTPASSASSVAQPVSARRRHSPVSARRRHRPPNTTNTTSTSATGASRSQPVVQMSNLIRSHKAVTTAKSSPPPAQLSAATGPAQMDHLPVGLGVSHVPTSSASSVAQPISARRRHCPVSARRRHRPPSTTDTTSTSATGASGSQPAKKNTRGPYRQLKTTKVTRVTNSRINIRYDEQRRAAATADQHSLLVHDIGYVVRTYCPMKWKSWKVMPDEMRTEVRGQLSTYYNLEDLDDKSLAYVNRLFDERYKQWKSKLHHHFQAFDDPQVALQEGCPKELEGREDSWAWLCGHFQEPDYVKKAKANKGNRDKKTLLHHSGSRPFSYGMEARQQGGVQIPGDRRLW